MSRPFTFLGILNDGKESADKRRTERNLHVLSLEKHRLVFEETFIHFQRITAVQLILQWIFLLYLCHLYPSDTVKIWIIIPLDLGFIILFLGTCLKCVICCLRLAYYFSFYIYAFYESQIRIRTNIAFMLYNILQLSISFCWIGIVANSVSQTSESKFMHIFFAALTVTIVQFIISTSCTFLNHIGEKTSLRTVVTRGFGFSISWPCGLCKLEEIEDVSIAARVEVMKGLSMALLLSSPGFFLVSEGLFLIVSRYSRTNSRVDNI
ncbi:unnamed protein product [Oikopleura dioica]|uniref:Uncharacterized protein n=1 Tax=Oikopleura dioica TaxID=34765 RepID=E4Z3J7_OIKDI|nr:unnamed protein product [Oikopleura dioica]